MLARAVRRISAAHSRRPCVPVKFSPLHTLFFFAARFSRKTTEISTQRECKDSGSPDNVFSSLFSDLRRRDCCTQTLRCRRSLSSSPAPASLWKRLNIKRIVRSRMNFENLLLGEGGRSAVQLCLPLETAIYACLGVRSILPPTTTRLRCSATRCNHKTRNEAKKLSSDRDCRKQSKFLMRKFVVEPENQDSMRFELAWQHSEMKKKFHRISSRVQWLENSRGAV